MTTTIKNKIILQMLIKDVFGSLLLSPGKWPLVEEGGFSVGRTYFYDRDKKHPPLNGKAAEKIVEVYRYALKEESYCDYDPFQVSRTLCDVLEELVPGESFQYLKFHHQDTKDVLAVKREGLLAVVALLCKVAADREKPNLEEVRARYVQDLRPVFLAKLSPGAEARSDGKEEKKAATEVKADSLYSLSDSMIYPDAMFIGREEELAAMRRLLHLPNNKLFLTGMGGIGKSELARQYATRFRDDYQRVLWVSAAGNLVHTVADDFLLPVRGFKRLDYPDDSEETYFRRKCNLLRELAGRETLLVVDNFDCEEDAGLWEFLEGAYSVIFTTRIKRKNHRLQEMQILPLTSAAELHGLFQMQYERGMAPEEAVALDKLIALLGGHTLSLRLCASILRLRRISPSRLLEHLQKGRTFADSPTQRAQAEIQEGIRSIFAIAQLSREEQFLLHNLACIPLSGISAEELFDWCEFDDYEVLEGLIRKNLVMHQSVNDIVHLHPVIASVAQEQLLADDDDVRVLLKNFCFLTAEMKRAILSEKERILNYATYIVSIPFPSDEARTNSLIALGLMYLHFGIHEAAEEMLERSLKFIPSIEEKMRIYILMAQIRTYSGKPKDGRELAFSGLKIIEEMEGQTSGLSPILRFRKTGLLMRVAESSRSLGEMSQDAYYCHKALETAEGLYGGVESVLNHLAEQPRTILVWDWERLQIGKDVFRYHLRPYLPEQYYGWIFYHLGESCLVRKEAEKAERYARKAMICFETANDVWAQYYVHNLLGYILCLKGCFGEAVAEVRQAYEGLSTLFGKYPVGSMLAYLIFLYRKQGDVQEEEKMIREAKGLYSPAGVDILLEEAKSLEDAPWMNPTSFGKRLMVALRECMEDTV